MKSMVYGGVVVCMVLLVLGGVYQVYTVSHHKNSLSNTSVTFVIFDGEDTENIAERLKERSLIKSKWIFIWELKRTGLFGKLQAGTYEISTGLTPREIAILLSESNADLQEVIITFPEGWTASKMAERLMENTLPGEKFLVIAKDPTQDIFESYPFLLDISGENPSLEGYLFPDTYHFFQNVTAEEIIEKMLKNYDRRTENLRAEVASRGENWREKVILASIIESEVRTDVDRKIVSGIFQSRLAINMALQSDATLSYVLNSGKTHHSGAELETNSPYNTYKYPGLPPGPVSNPSLDALEAAVHPEESDYLYFLSNPETGQTYFAVTFEEHKANKIKAGL